MGPFHLLVGLQLLKPGMKVSNIYTHTTLMHTHRERGRKGGRKRERERNRWISLQGIGGLFLLLKDMESSGAFFLLFLLNPYFLSEYVLKTCEKVVMGGCKLVLGLRLF